ncbi:MAG TPA: DUF2062 domain-containing protein [Acidobacteriota bacterium]|jgi:hypothetical protein
MNAFFSRLLRRIVSSDESPERLSLSFSIGTFLSFAPPIGLHTLIGLAIAYFFRLNKAAMLVGIYVNNPWTIVPYYAFATWVGIKLTGLPSIVAFPDMGIRQLLNREFWIYLAAQWRVLIPITVGSTVLAVLIGLATYPIMLMLIRRYRRRLGLTGKEGPRDGGMEGWRD